MAKTQSTPARPPGTEPMYSVTCKDVVMGRGSGTQNHCGNVTYRKLVYLNKELYATSTKFDKLKISKAIVAAVREFGGHFVQADDKRGGLYFDIGDKRAWDKTSQALREGQAEVRARLAEDDPNGMSKISEYKQVISEQTFFAYACRMLESLYHPATGGAAGSSACGQQCPHAKRRQTLNQIGADPVRIYSTMQSFMRSPAQPPAQLPSPPPSHTQSMGSHLQGFTEKDQPYSVDMPLGGWEPNLPPPILSANPNHKEDIGSIEPLPYIAPAPEGGGHSHQPLPFASENSFKGFPPAKPVASTHPSDVDSATATYEPLPYEDGHKPHLQRPALLSEKISSGSVFSLRQFCSEDLEITSEEGKILMDQLNQEVDSLIRRKSHGLIQIDTTHAFEDLVFEDDSMELDGVEGVSVKELNKEAILPPKNRDSSSSSSGKISTLSTSRYSGNSGGTGGRISGLSYKDDISLMNMSILTLDEKGEDVNHRSFSEIDDVNNAGSLERGDSWKDGSYSKEETFPPKSVLRQKSIGKKRDTRVSFAGKNISITSMDDRSFSQLVDSISDPDGDYAKGDEIRSPGKGLGDSLKMSRKMGFPMRQTVLKKVGAHLPCEVGQEDVRSQEMISNLSINEDFPHSSFKKMAGKVENPSGVANSLREMDMSLSNVGALGMSNMSLSSDIDPELLS